MCVTLPNCNTNSRVPFPKNRFMLAFMIDIYFKSFILVKKSFFFFTSIAIAIYLVRAMYILPPFIS